MKSEIKEQKNLQPWNVGKEDCNTKSNDGGKKDIDIPRWRVLKYAQSAASSCEQVTNGDVMKKDEYMYTHEDKKERTPTA